MCGPEKTTEANATETTAEYLKRKGFDLNRLEQDRLNLLERSKKNQESTQKK